MEASLQRILKSYQSHFEVAKKYYSILFDINNLNVTKNELELVAFIAVYGSISIKDNREAFKQGFGVSSASIYNMVSKLKKLDILIKEKNKVLIHPTLLPDFSNLILIIKLEVNGN